MKTNNVIFGKGSGRVGATLNRIVRGVQIEGAMPSKMTNPNTDAQQDTRARFKLASQLSAIMKNVIAIPRKGLVSGRNRFVQINMDNTTYDNDSAVIDFRNLQLTDSNHSFGYVEIDKDAEDPSFYYIIYEGKENAYDKVVVAVYKRDSNDNLIFLKSVVKNYFYQGSIMIDGITDASLFFIYGIKYLKSGAAVKYGNMGANPSEYIAKLISTQKNTSSDIRLSKTASVCFLPGQKKGHGGSITTFGKLYTRVLGDEELLCIVNEDGGLVTNAETPTSSSYCIYFEEGSWVVGEVGELPLTNSSKGLPTSAVPNGTNNFSVMGWFFDNIGAGKWVLTPTPSEYPE